MRNLSHLPNIVSTLQDGNLDTARVVSSGDSILILGTSTKGPKNSPTAIRTPEAAVAAFGSAESGTLVRGFCEAYYAPGAVKDIRLCRITNGNTAELIVNESAGTEEKTETVDAVTGLAIPAMTVTANDPGDIYNSVSFRQEIVNGQLSVVGYNPVSGLESVIPFDPTAVVSGSVSDVVGLVAAINADTNLAGIVTAEANEIRTSFELDVQKDMPYVDASGSIVINLVDAFKLADTDDDYTVDTSDVAVANLAANINVDPTAVDGGVVTTDALPVFMAADSTGYLKIYHKVGDVVTDMEIVQYDGVDIATKTYSVKIVDVAPTGVIAADEYKRGMFGTTIAAHTTANSTVVEQYVPVFPFPASVTASNRLVKLNEVYQLNDMAAELSSSGKAAVSLPYPIQMSGALSIPLLKLDGSVDLVNDGEAKHLVRNSYIGVGDGETKAFTFTAYEAIDSDAVDGDGDLELKFFRTSTAGQTVLVPKDDGSGVGWTLTDVGGGDGQVAAVTIEPAPSSKSIITVSYNSEAFALTQHPTLSAVTATHSYKSYFAAGKKITFGTAQPADMAIYYSAKVVYTIDKDVIISDAAAGKIAISAGDNQPDIDNIRVFGFDYDYQPEWVNLSASQSLQGGTNGIIMSNIDKYDVLTDTYAAIADYPVDIITVMNTYLDDTKVVYDDETGLPIEVNAGFVQQLNAHLESMMDGVNEAFGVMAVKPADSPKIDDVASWFTKLTVTSTSDLTRAANVMAGLDARLINVVAYEPVIANNVITYPYAATGEAHYAGLVSQLVPKSATTNKSLGTEVLALRYNLSARQLDKLTELRYVGGRLISGIGPVVCDGVTAAATGSDWVRLSTFRIAAAAMNVVRAVGRPFLGEGFNDAKKAALDTAISKGLLAMQEDGALRSFSFAIHQTPAEVVAGVARIPLVLGPAFELRRIAVEVKLTS